MTKAERTEQSNLENIRKALGMTQQELAVELDVAIATISRCERGIADMRLTLKQWQKLANLVRYRIGQDIRDWPLVELHEKKISGLPLDK